MFSLIRAPVLALFALFGSSGVVAADTVVNTAKNWGLLGIWKIDCGAKATTPNGTALKYVERDGKLVHDRDWGASKDSNLVVSAQVVDNDFVITVRFDKLNQTRQWALRKQDADHMRTMWNKNIDTDDYSIRDGKVTSNGNETAVLTRCR